MSSDSSCTGISSSSSTVKRLPPIRPRIRHALTPLTHPHPHPYPRPHTQQSIPKKHFQQPLEIHPNQPCHRHQTTSSHHVKRQEHQAPSGILYLNGDIQAIQQNPKASIIPKPTRATPTSTAKQLTSSGKKLILVRFISTFSAWLW